MPVFADVRVLMASADPMTDQFSPVSSALDSRKRCTITSSLNRKLTRRGAVKKSLPVACILGVVTLLSGCSATDHARSVQAGQDGDRLTVGTVQREIHEGMSGGEVIEVLGSPNVVTTDEKRREVWVYDKIATESVRSESSGGITALIFGPIGAAGAAGLGSANYSSGASSKSQRTFTVIIKFNEQGTVRDFAYHTSRF